MIKKDNIVQELESRGAKYSLDTKYRHPSVIPIINSSVSGKLFFDLEKTADTLISTLNFMEGCGRDGKVILFVSTRRESIDILEKTVKALSMPYMFYRWVGGTLSNFSNIRSRVNRMETLREERDTNVWSKFTKKERILLDRDLRRLESLFIGINELTRLPDAVFIIDTHKNKIALTEALNENIPVISLSNADADTTIPSYQITTNINSRDNLIYIMDLLQEAYLKGVKSKGKNKSDKSTEKKV